MAIQRQSDKHSPRIDEELDHATASLTHGAPVGSRSRTDLRQEDPAEDSDATAAPGPGVPHGIDPASVELRSELGQSLRPSVFPAGRDALVAAATEENAPVWVLAGLGRLEEGRTFNVLEEVFEALGGPSEDHRA